MATPSIKATYTVDIETKRSLDRLASHWAVSRSEALRRAIRQAAGASAASHRLAALTALQEQARLARVPLSRWSKQQRAQRRASSVRVEPGPE